MCDSGFGLKAITMELQCGRALAGPGGTRFGAGVGPAWHRELQHAGNESLPASCPRGPQGPALPLLMTLAVVTCTCKDLGGLHATCVAGTQTGVGLGLTTVCGENSKA